MICIGTSGFSYADWIGPFYPYGTSRREMLEIYARRFQALEVNASFYAPLGERAVAGMVERTNAKLLLIFKLHRSISHEREKGSELALALRQSTACVRPARERGVLDGFLLQFPQSFHSTPANIDYLRRLEEALAGERVFVEIRANDWLAGKGFEALAASPFIPVSVDAPPLEGLPAPRFFLKNGVGFIRFHGRNAGLWHSSGTDASARYDYDYSEGELSEWAGRILKAPAVRLYIFFNNHPRGQAPKNARALARQLGLPGLVREEGQGDLFSMAGEISAR